MGLCEIEQRHRSCHSQVSAERAFALVFEDLLAGLSFFGLVFSSNIIINVFHPLVRSRHVGKSLSGPTKPASIQEAACALKS